jgi:hypothetical protein
MQQLESELQLSTVQASPSSQSTGVYSHPLIVSQLVFWQAIDEQITVL